MRPPFCDRAPAVPPDGRIGTDVKHDGAVGCAAHPAVRDAHHVLHARARRLMPAGSADTPPPACPMAAQRGPAFCSTMKVVRGATSRSGAVDAGREIVERGRTPRRALRVSNRRRIGGGALRRRRSVGARRAEQGGRGRRCGCMRLRERPDDVAVDPTRALPPVARRASRPATVVTAEMQEGR